MKINKKKIVDNVSNNKTVCLGVLVVIFVFCICILPLINKATHSGYVNSITVYDEDGILSVTCPADADVLEEVTCQIELGTNLPMDVHGFSAKLSSTNSLTFKEFKYSDDTSWSKYNEVNYISSDGLVLISDGASDEEIIGEVVYIVSKDIDITKDLEIYFKDIVITDENGVEREIGNIDIEMYVSSSIANTLESITLSNGTLNETFDKNKNEYTATVNSDSVVISVVPTDERAFVMGSQGEVSLEVGENVFEIKVYNKNGGEPNIYRLTITREQSGSTEQLSDINTLESITLSNGTLNETFDKDRNEYTALIDSDTVSINVVKTDSKSTVKGLASEYIIHDGVTLTVSITVTSESGIDNVYTVSISRKTNDFSVTFDEKLDVDKVNKYIKNISCGMTVLELINQVTVSNGELELYGINNEEKSNDSLLFTGDVLRIYLDGAVKEEYTISVLGDSSSDGKIGTMDLVQARKHIVGYINEDGSVYEKIGVYKLALDMNGDGKVNTIDVLRIRKIIVGVEE